MTSAAGQTTILQSFLIKNAERDGYGALKQPASGKTKEAIASVLPISDCDSAVDSHCAVRTGKADPLSVQRGSFHHHIIGIGLLTMEAGMAPSPIGVRDRSSAEPQQVPFHSSSHLLGS